MGQFSWLQWLSTSGDPRSSSQAVAGTQNPGVGTSTTNCRCAPYKDLAQKKPAAGFLPKSWAGVMEDSGDHRLSRQSTIMGPAGLTAVFGMGTGVTPPVWSPENRPAGCQATPAAIPRWSVTGTWSSRHTRSSGTSARTKTNPLSSGICHLSSGICHLPFAIWHLSSVICQPSFGSNR